MLNNQSQLGEGNLRENLSNIMNDPNFRVGQTKKEIVWKRNKATLYYYPSKSKKYKIPLFLIYSLINESYILDLYPGMSMIEAFGQEGYDVYLLDFGKPGYEDHDLTLDDYIIKYIQTAVKKTLVHSEATELTIIGYCLGGTLATIYTAICDEPVKNLILFATPIDFERSPFLQTWSFAVKRGDIDIDSVIDAYGVIPAKLVYLALKMAIAPITFTSYMSLMERADDEESVRKWLLFNKWVKGHIPFAGATLKQLINVFKENQLIKDQLIIKGNKVKLACIESNLLVLSTTGDQIVPEHLTTPIVEKVSSVDKQFKRLKGGHVTIAMRGEIPIEMVNWLSERSDLI